jgi:tRNA threonylcarbamoyladenosine biosynthesis protein TsaE
MSEEKKPRHQITSTTPEQTERLAEQLGKVLKGGEVIELISDLGGGKTTFVRGLVRGSGSTDRVGSPTFTISRFYTTPRTVIHHFDFYRLAEPGIMANELAEVAGDSQSVVVVEWANVVRQVLPEDRLTVIIRVTPEGYRTITLESPEKLRYLIEALK